MGRKRSFLKCKTYYKILDHLFYNTPKSSYKIAGDIALSQSNVYMHLIDMRNKGYVVQSAENKHRYTITKKTIELMQLQEKYHRYKDNIDEILSRFEELENRK